MTTRLVRRSLALVLACAVLTAVTASHAQVGGFFNNRSVGGVTIDPDGVVSSPTVDDHGKLDELRRSAPIAAAGDLQKLVDLRAVSLKKIEAALAEADRKNEPAPDEVAFLAGLLRVQYVLVYPERNDIVLAGPAEGWKVDRLGNVVGETTNRPVLMLDDLMVALRAAAASQLEPISCSIDPTPEGVRRLRSVSSRLRTIGNPEQTMAKIEDALGPQVISVTGIPADSHFARTLVAADFRMKRLAMNFEPAPVDGMPSFLHMMKQSRRGATSMMPRWWLAANYQPLAKSADGLAWQIRGQGVQCLTESDHFDAAGRRQETGQADPIAARWAENMTDRFSDLADHDSAFGQLRNAMDLAVVSALLVRQKLWDQSNLDAPHLLEQAELASYPIPRSTASKASFVRKGRDWLVSASGGVQILPWEIADQGGEVAEIGPIRSRFDRLADAFWAE